MPSATRPWWTGCAPPRPASIVIVALLLVRLVNADRWLRAYWVALFGTLIGLMELLAQTKQTAEFSANIFEAFTLATVIYFVLNMSLMTLMSLVEKKVRIPGMMGGAK